MPKNTGYTLLELVIVVSVIGILAGIALPDLVRPLTQARTAQAEMLLHAIAHRVHVAREEGRAVESCGPTPSQVPGPKAVPFPITECWRALGFDPHDRVHYQFELKMFDDRRFVVTATGDLDDDQQPQVFTLDDGIVSARVPGAL